MTLEAFVARALAAPVPPAVADAAARIAADHPGALAVLFYGSNLRTGVLDGVVDFYVLTDGPPERGLWPRVGYREIAVECATVRVKVAAVTLAMFRDAAEGRRVDTTIWTRFVQPCALAWVADAWVRGEAGAAVAAAARTAAGFAAMLGPAEGAAADYWLALFRATYATELRVERPGRERSILAHAPDHFAALLPVAWAASGIPFSTDDGRFQVRLPADRRRRLRRAWSRRRWAGRPLNVARLVRAAFTFDGAARYGAWKVERHTGLSVPLTPWMERHPILAAPGVLWRVWRARG